MATGKDRKPKRRRKTYAPDNPEQSRKFLEAAKKLGADSDGKAFEAALRHLTRKPKAGSS